MSRPWSRRDVAVSLSGAALLSSIGGPRAEGREAAAPAVVRFKDLTGQEIALAAPARRIVDLWTVGAAFAVAAHGSASRLVAINDRAHSMLKRGLVGRLFPEILELPSDILGGAGAPNVERLVSLNPDLVVDFRAGGRQASAVMRNAGLTVASYERHPGGIGATIKALLFMFGEMIGDTSRAERIAAVLDETVAPLRAFASAPHDARPSALIVMPTSHGFYASGGGASSEFADLIYSAGGSNAAAKLPGHSLVSPEQIAAWDPDVMLLFQSDGVHPRQILDHAVLGGIKAAVSRRVYVLPIGANNWGSIGPDEFLAQVWLGELLHPDKSATTLRADMRKAYEAIFGRTLAETVIDGVLRKDLNGGSAGYARFLRGA